MQRYYSFEKKEIANLFLGNNTYYLKKISFVKNLSTKTNKIILGAFNANKERKTAHQKKGK
jgi:hypothetical protein